MTEWISVKDAMPELVPVGSPPHPFVARSKWVLVCGWADKEFYCTTADLRRGGQGIDDREVRWNTEADVFWNRNHLVTHWMPLPQPPNQRSKSPDVSIIQLVQSENDIGPSIIGPFDF